MAKATMDDLAAALKELNQTVRETAEGTATQRATDAEEASERKQYDAEVLNSLKSINEGLTKSFGTFKQGDKKSGGLIAGLLGSMGALSLGALGKAVGKLAMGFAKGMIALGAGIGGFILALGVTDVLMGLMGASGENLKILIQNFFGAFSDKTAMMMGGLILLGVTMVKFKISSTRFMTAMTALGMGIAGFFTGIAVGDWVAQNAKSAAGIDGKSLGSLIENFFGGMSTKAVGMMGGLVTLAGTMALVGGKVGIVKTPMDAVTQAAGLMTGMTAMGLGIAGFFTGIMVGDFIAKKFDDAAGIDGGSLSKLMGNFFSAFDNPASMTILFGLLTAAAGVGVKAAQTPAGAIKMAAGIMTGMTAMGLGMVGFFTAIAVGDFIAKTMKTSLGADGGSLKTLMDNFFSIFDSKTKVSALIGIMSLGTLTGYTASKSPTAAVNAMGGIIGGMTAIGLGLAGFFTGIAVGDFIAATLENAAGADGSSLKTLMGNFFDIFDSKEKVAALMGVLTAAGGVASLAAVSPALAAKAMGGLIGGMTAIGLGLAGFFSGIAIGDFLTATLTDASKSDGSALKKLMDNFFDIFDSESKVKTLMVILGAATIVGVIAAVATPKAGLAAGIGIFTGMTAIGLGLAGFTIGVLAGDFIAKLGQMASLDGSSMNKLMTNVLGAFDGIKIETLTAIFLLVAGASINPVGVLAGMTAIGLGLAGFMVGVLGAEFLAKLSSDKGAGLIEVLGNVGKAIGKFIGGMGNSTFKALGDMKDKEIDRLARIGSAISDLGMGLLAFAGGQAAKSMSDVFSSITSFFGGDKNPLEAFVKISKDEAINVDRLSAIGSGISILANGLRDVASIDHAKMNQSIEGLQKLGIIKDTSLTGALERRVAGWIAPEEMMQSRGATTGAPMLAGSQGMSIHTQGNVIIQNNVDASQRTSSTNQTHIKEAENPRAGYIMIQPGVQIGTG